MSAKGKVVYKQPGASREHSGEGAWRQSPRLCRDDSSKSPGQLPVLTQGHWWDASWANTLIWGVWGGSGKKSLCYKGVYRSKGTSGFMWLIFLSGILFTLENFNVLERLCSAFFFVVISTITSKLQPWAIIVFNSLLSALNPKKLTTTFSRSTFINSSCN